MFTSEQLCNPFSAFLKKKRTFFRKKSRNKEKIILFLFLLWRAHKDVISKIAETEPDGPESDLQKQNVETPYSLSGLAGNEMMQLLERHLTLCLMKLSDLESLELKKFFAESKKLVLETYLILNSLHAPRCANDIKFWLENFVKVGKNNELYPEFSALVADCLGQTLRRMHDLFLLALDVVTKQSMGFFMMTSCEIEPLDYKNGVVSSSYEVILLKRIIITDSIPNQLDMNAKEYSIETPRAQNHLEDNNNKFTQEQKEQDKRRILREQALKLIEECHEWVDRQNIDELPFDRTVPARFPRRRIGKVPPLVKYALMAALLGSLLFGLIFYLAVQFIPGVGQLFTFSLLLIAAAEVALGGGLLMGVLTLISFKCMKNSRRISPINEGEQENVKNESKRVGEEKTVAPKIELPAKKQTLPSKEEAFSKEELSSPQTVLASVESIPTHSSPSRSPKSPRVPTLRLGHIIRNRELQNTMPSKEGGDSSEKPHRGFT